MGKALKKTIQRPGPSGRTSVPDVAVFQEEFPPPGRQLPTVQQVVLSRSGVVGENFRLLRAKVRALDEAETFNCFGLTSSAAREGKSTVALGLAAAIAEEGNRQVIVVDADLRNPRLASYLAVPPGPGLAEWLAGRTSELSVQRIDPPGFVLLPAGDPSGHRPDLLGSARMASLLDLLRATFDVVIVDCPPVGPVVDSVILQDLLDGFLFVVRSRQTPRQAILAALSHLTPGKIRGVVLNDQRELIPGYEKYVARYGSPSSDPQGR